MRIRLPAHPVTDECAELLSSFFVCLLGGMPVNSEAVRLGLHIEPHDTDIQVAGLVFVIIRSEINRVAKMISGFCSTSVSRL